MLDRVVPEVDLLRCFDAELAPLWVPQTVQFAMQVHLTQGRYSLDLEIGLSLFDSYKRFLDIVGAWCYFNIHHCFHMKVRQPC